MYLVPVSRRSLELLQHNVLDDIDQVPQLRSRASAFDYVNFDKRHSACVVMCYASKVGKLQSYERNKKLEKGFPYLQLDNCYLREN